VTPQGETSLTVTTPSRIDEELKKDGEVITASAIAEIIVTDLPSLSALQNDGISAKIDLIGEEKPDPSFWKMPLGSRIIIFDSLHSTEHIAERINEEGAEAWRLFVDSGMSSSICFDTDLSNSLVIRGSEGIIRFVRAEADSSASGKIPDNILPSDASVFSIAETTKASSSVADEAECVIPAYSLRGMGVSFLEVLHARESDQIWNGTSRQEFQGGGSIREWQRLVSPAYDDQGYTFDRAMSAHKLATPHAQCPSVSSNALNKGCKYDATSARAFIRVGGVSLSNCPDISSLTLAPCTALMDEKVLKEQGPSTHIRADAIEANTCRYLQDGSKIAVMGIAIIVQINDINSSPGDNEEKLPSSVWAYGCLMNERNEFKPAIVTYKSIMTMNDQYTKQLPDFAAQVNSDTLKEVHEVVYEMLSIPGRFKDDTMFFMVKQTGRIPRLLVGSGGTTKKSKRKSKEKVDDADILVEEGKEDAEDMKKEKKISKKTKREKSARAKRNAQCEDATVSEDPSDEALALVPHGGMALVPHGGMAISALDRAKKPRGGVFSIPNISKKSGDVANMFDSVFTSPGIAKSGFAGGFTTMFSLIQQNASLQTAAQCNEERFASENALRQVFEAKNEALRLRERSLEEERLEILKQSTMITQEIQSANNKSQVEALQRAYEHGSEVLLQHAKNAQLISSPPLPSACSTGRRVSMSLDEQLGRIGQLRTEAKEIRSKSESIPYPDVREKLLRKADEKEAEANALIESM